MPPVPDDHINVTPLIDVVMCLIIFFMICGTLARHDAVAGINLPQARLGQQLTDQHDRLVLNIVPSPHGTPTLEIRGQAVSNDQLPALLRAQARRNSALKVIIRADQKTPYEYIAPVLTACAAADIHSVNFSTQAMTR